MPPRNNNVVIMRARGPQAWLLPLSWVYGFATRTRNLFFDLGLKKKRRLSVPVLSVGNLAAGGSGKTPLICWLVEAFQRKGIRIGVLARGYARQAGERLNDEGKLLASRFPDLPQEQAPDRYLAGQTLLARSQVDLLLLDDGFQHRKLHRDLDVCCLDAQDPYAGGRLLPAGWLREPGSALRRADIVVLTGAEACSPQDLSKTKRELEESLGKLSVLVARSVPRELVELPSGRTHPPGYLAGKSCILLAAIARPMRFRKTVEALGGRVVGGEFLRDHAVIPMATLGRLSREAQARGHLLVTTEKDEARIPGDAQSPRHVLRIDMDLADTAAALTCFLERLPALGKS